jgi:hypothetical protein
MSSVIISSFLDGLSKIKEMSVKVQGFEEEEEE